jgi:hypothetical protein
MTSINDITINSDQYPGLCIARDISICNSPDYLVVNYPIADPNLNSALTSVHRYTRFTSSNSDVIGNGNDPPLWAGEYYLLNDFSNAFEMATTPTPQISTVITVTQLETDNYTAASTDFTLTIIPVAGTDGGGGDYCFNSGVQLFSNPVCLCKAGHSGNRCEQ